MNDCIYQWVNECMSKVIAIADSMVDCLNGCDMSCENGFVSTTIRNGYFYVQ